MRKIALFVLVFIFVFGFVAYVSEALLPRIPSPISIPTPTVRLPYVTNSVLVTYVEGMLEGPQDPLPGVKVLVSDGLYGASPNLLIEKTTDTRGIASFSGLILGQEISGAAYKPGFKPEFVYHKATRTPAYRGALHHTSLVLWRLHPFTSEMLSSTRVAKVKVYELKRQRGETVGEPSAGAKVIITKSRAGRAYGVETTTLSDGSIPELSLPDSESLMDEGSSGTHPLTGAPFLYTIYVYKSGYCLGQYSATGADNIFSDRGVRIDLQKPLR